MVEAKLLQEPLHIHWELFKCLAADKLCTWASKWVKAAGKNKGG